MKIFGWLSNSKHKRALSNSKGSSIPVEKVMSLSKTFEELKPFFGLFVNYLKYLLDSEQTIALRTREIQAETSQKLIEDRLFRELRCLRYVHLHVWFFNLKPPKSQSALDDELLTINSALKFVLNDRNKVADLPLFENALGEYFDANELRFTNLPQFMSVFGDKVSERITQTAFDSTEGRLAGQLHDFVVELMMTTLIQDKKILELDDPAVTREESGDIKRTIEEIRDTRSEIIRREFLE